MVVFLDPFLKNDRSSDRGFQLTQFGALGEILVLVVLRQNIGGLPKCLTIILSLSMTLTPDIF